MVGKACDEVFYCVDIATIEAIICLTANNLTGINKIKYNCTKYKTKYIFISWHAICYSIITQYIVS